MSDEKKKLEAKVDAAISLLKSRLGQGSDELIDDILRPDLLSRDDNDTAACIANIHLHVYHLMEKPMAQDDLVFSAFLNGFEAGVAFLRWRARQAPKKPS